MFAYVVGGTAPRQTGPVFAEDLMKPGDRHGSVGTLDGRVVQDSFTQLNRVRGRGAPHRNILKGTA
jgi:hypothetical protein